MATKNSILNTSSPLSSTAITIDSPASTDSYIQYTINTTEKFKLGADDTDDSLRLSQGNALGTNDTFIINSSGYRSMPLQPMFSAYTTSSVLNVTGDGTYYKVIFGSEVFDSASNYNTSTGIFTAPVTGKYLLSVIIYYGIKPTGGTATHGGLVTSNRGYGNYYWPTRNKVSGFLGGGNYLMNQISFIADMDASDTAYYNFYSGGGSKVDEIGGTWSKFTGYLLG